MVEERVQRRLAAILAADVVGYSRMMEADEAGTLARLRALRRELFEPITKKYGGRIFKTTGDGALVEFKSATDAVESAVAIQHSIGERDTDMAPKQRIQLRIGISLGDVIPDGADLYGNGVNVAARMEALAEPGGVCISGNVHEHVGSAAGLAFDDLGERRVKNLNRRVRAFRVQIGPAAESPSPEADQSMQLLDRPSIALLPFENMSGDPEQEYFSDGMAEDLITDLSKLPGLFVAARNASFAFKGGSRDPGAVAQRLGVQFVLEGSVRKMGERLRINVQLISAADGGHVWAERYDGAMSEIFEFQDRIRGEIIAALELRLTPTDIARSEPRRTRSVAAYDHYLNGRRHYYRYTAEDSAKAFQSLNNAIELDPDFADAHAYLSACHVGTFIVRWPGAEDGLEQGLAAAERAVTLDPTSAVAHTRLGWALTWLHRHDEAERAFERAEALGPETAEVFIYYGMSQNYAGNPERGLQLTSKAQALDPFTPNIEYHLGVEYLLLDRYADAVEKLESARDRTPSQLGIRLHLASAYVEAGRVEDASWEISAILGLSPDYTVALADRSFPYRVDDVRWRFLDNLRNAGLPE